MLLSLMNVDSWLKKATTQISRLDAELILANSLGVERVFLHAHPELAITQDQQKQADKNLARRAQNEPLAYIFGSKEFYGRIFKVTPDVLIPRPETEEIIEIVKSLTFSPDNTQNKQLEPIQIIDIGTGSGCIAITLSLELPNSNIFAVDISQKALECAKYNAQNLGATSISMIESDLLGSPALKGRKFDIIVANLPYVNPDWSWLGADIKYEPDLALYAEDNGLALIKRLLDDAIDYLNDDAYLILESDIDQHATIIDYAIKTQTLDFIKASGLMTIFRKKSAK